MFVQLGEGGDTIAVHARDWHATRDAAVARVAQVRDERIAALERMLTAARAIDPEGIVPQ